MSLPSRNKSAVPFTEAQGQYLTYIFYYTKLMHRSPAESDMQHYFQVTPPSVHRMVIELERKGLIRLTPFQARSIELILPQEALPPLR